MAEKQLHLTRGFDGDHRLFTAQVTPDPGRGWRTVINLGDGASLSKWFEDEQEARHYPDELTAWLRGR